MKIVVASGKGGVGKTLVATNLASIASRREGARLYDLDVEAPDCHLFFEAAPDAAAEVVTVETMLPRVDETRCTHCGVCSEVCEFHAIVSLPDRVLVFPELCRGCGGCRLLCPEGAVLEGSKEIGTVSVSRRGGLTLISGRLRVGETATTALIRQTKTVGEGSGGLALYDAPPGTSCPVIEAVKDADYVVVVTEPTPFGLHDFGLLADTLSLLGRPFGVVVNKAVAGDERIEDRCRERGIEVLLRLPERSEIAAAYSRGDLVADAIPGMAGWFEEALATVRRAAGEVVA
jgi:MinD superfamily P-loop ATPase